MAESTVPLATPVEIASCTVANGPSGGSAPDGRVTGPRLSPLAALESAVLAGLKRPPCVVSFSGGMDSTFVLYVAAKAARAAGLPAPIPVTWRFTGAPRAEESRWQDRVMATMPGLEWEVLQAADDLDLIGPIARRVLTRHGVLLPPNVHLHLPIIELAAGGSVLTGVGGDQILVGPPRRGATARARARVPSGLVAAVRQRQGRDQFPWLRPAASRAAFSNVRRGRREGPLPLDQRISWRARQRDLALTSASLNTIAAPSDVQVINPLLDRRFLAALGASELRHQDPSRADLLRWIGGDAFPAAASDARPKARFLEVFLRTPTREFVQAWDGRGADDSVVDSRALQHLWSQWPIPSSTAGLVQQLWLSSTKRVSRRLETHR